MKDIILGIKIDVDTARGTKIGVPNLLNIFDSLKIPATFLFSLGPDNTGRAIRRIFRPGFFKKVSRTSILSTYGLRTLLNGLLWPGPHIAKNYKAIMQSTFQKGHEVGIHTYDHVYWQDKLQSMTPQEIEKQVELCCQTFKEVFGFAAKTMGAAGWQANKHSLKAYDDANFLYASDSRGHSPFYPKIDQTIFNTLQIPTTLPTLDELIGRPEFPSETIKDYYISLLKPGINILTIHAEVEGMKHKEWFIDFLETLNKKGIVFKTLESIALDLKKEEQPVFTLIQGTVDGRSGTLACQG